MNKELANHTEGLVPAGFTAKSRQRFGHSAVRTVAVHCRSSQLSIQYCHSAQSSQQCFSALSRQHCFSALWGSQLAIEH